VVVVAGMELSGMSRIVVTPPAAAARVADAKPSHSVRPGSLTWTCVSTRPGIRTSSSRRVMICGFETALRASSTTGLVGSPGNGFETALRASSTTGLVDSPGNGFETALRASSTTGAALGG
jgi:hypothetical protein